MLSGAVYTGAFFSGGDISIIPKSGLSIGADLEARNNLFGMYTNFTYDISNVKGTVYNTGNETKIIHIIEIYLGPRWYIGRGKLNGLIDAGLGYYRLEGEGAFGLNIGSGLNYALSKNFDLALKGKYHLLGINYFTGYAGFTVGLRYYFNK